MVWYGMGDIESVGRGLEALPAIRITRVVFLLDAGYDIAPEVHHPVFTLYIHV